MSPFSSWIMNDLMPPVRRWLQVERVPLEARALQARARRALSIGEVDQHVHNFAVMNTGALMILCKAAAAEYRVWIEPSGAVDECTAQGHGEWVKQNMERLVAEGLAPREPEKQGFAAVAQVMMQAGWVKFSTDLVMAFLPPNEQQDATIKQIIAQMPPEFPVNSFIISKGINVSVPAGSIASKGFTQAATDAAAGIEHQADMGGASDGPFQQGDGQDVGNTYQEQLQDGSTAPIDKSYQYMPQDWLPETWWAQQLLQYKEKSYPGTPQPGAQSDLPASGTGPGQQFASAVHTVIVAAEGAARREEEALRVAGGGVGDPSDTDGQHDQVNEDAMTTPVDPDSQLYKGDKGRGPITTELKTHLGHRWFDRKSDKAVEQKIITMEKDHLEPGEIKSELRQDGIPANVIDETYQNREKNLFKVVDVRS